jgi:hypothetical protein
MLILRRTIRWWVNPATAYLAMAILHAVKASLEGRHAGALIGLVEWMSVVCYASLALPHWFPASDSQNVSDVNTPDGFELKM